MTTIDIDEFLRSNMAEEKYLFKQCSCGLILQEGIEICPEINNPNHGHKLSSVELTMEDLRIAIKNKKLLVINLNIKPISLIY